MRPLIFLCVKAQYLESSSHQKLHMISFEDQDVFSKSLFMLIQGKSINLHGAKTQMASKNGLTSFSLQMIEKQLSETALDKL